MASQADLALAKKLLAARVLPEESLREAFAQQAELARRGRSYPLERVLYARKDIPAGSLDFLGQPGPLEAQPFRDYELHYALGEGGSSVVYAGVYLPNGAPVALKVLDPVQALRADFLERFKHEAQMLISLDHPHVVAGYECGFEGGRHFFSMDLIEGMTILEIIDRRGFLENDEALSITYQAAMALEYLHQSQYLHRDIKPSNIMVDGDGNARLIDLGLVRVMHDREGPASEEAMTVGTVEYVSPEQARGRSDLDVRSDIYSLGLSLYHMAVGEVPFQGDTDYEVMAKQIMASLDTQKLKQRRIAPEIHFFITKMTSKDRESRFETVAEIVTTAEAYLPDGIVPIDFGPDPAPPVATPIQSAPPVAMPVARPIAAPVQPPAAKPVRPPAPPPIARPVAKPVKPVAPAAKPTIPPPPPPTPKPAPSTSAGQAAKEAAPAQPAPSKEAGEAEKDQDAKAGESKSADKQTDDKPKFNAPVSKRRRRPGQDGDAPKRRRGR